MIRDVSRVSDHGTSAYRRSLERCTRTGHAVVLNLPSPSHSIMSQTPSPANSHSNYQSIFDSALEAYKKKTGKDLTSDPLLRRLEACRSPDDIIVVLREHISGSDHPHSSSDGLTKCLNSTVNVLYTFSTIIGASPGLVSLDNVKFGAA